MFQPPTLRLVRNVLGAALSCVATLGVAAAGSTTSRPAPATIAAFHTAHPQHLPLGASNAMTTFVVEMAGTPVAVAAANAGGMDAPGKLALKARLKASQHAVEQAARGVGGQVLASYQMAYNGIKVRVPARAQDVLAAMPGVVAVHRLQVFSRQNIHGVPAIGAPKAWSGPQGLHGEGIKIADIDTGIDYTHADFGGPGTVDAYQAALASDTAAPDPALYGPSAPKVKGGTDLVGDDYNADPSSDTYQPVPHPDDNPLDCGEHGTHTAGTMAGFGVLDDGSTYHGHYGGRTVKNHAWKVGPGVAPMADLYAVRVFGCDGSTDMVVDAIEWSVSHGMDVINMSLGSPFGSANDPSAVASANAAAAGVLVIASAGNAGPAPYMVGSPSTGHGVISVAASDPTRTFPGAIMALSTGVTARAIDANGVPVNGANLPIKVLYNPGTTHNAGNISLGCDPAEYTSAGVTGMLVVVKRGTCARVAKAIFGQMAGAAAVLMINNVDAYPPFEGTITENPDDGTPYDVTIPFLGLPLSKGPRLVAADGGSVALSDAILANPGYLKLASFSSGGPRSNNDDVKPEVTAPGVAIASAGMGTGSGGLVLSGTSMAAPHVTGEAALVKQAHQGWDAAEWRAAIVNTADPGLVNGYSTRLAGVGFVQVVPATRTQVVAFGDPSTPTLGFGFNELAADYSASRTITLKNLGDADATFSVAVTHDAGRPHSMVPGSSSITVPARSTATLPVQLDVPAATAGQSFGGVAGLVEFAPTSGNNGVTLRVPFYMVPLAVSNIATTIDVRALKQNGSATATTTNAGGVVTGAADWYAWGQADGQDAGAGEVDLRAVGVQAFPGVLAFAVKTGHTWSNPAQDEFDIYVDVNGDSVDDYLIAAVDLGLILTGSYRGTTATVVIDLLQGTLDLRYLADAPFNASTLVMVADIDQLCADGSPCLSADNPRLTYHAESFGWDGGHDTADTPAPFNAFTPAIGTGYYDQVAPGDSAQETVTFDAAEWALTPSLGLMIVSHDNAGPKEAQLIAVH